MRWIRKALHHAFVTSHPRNKFCLWCGRVVPADQGHRLPYGVFCDETHAQKDKLSRHPH